MYSDYEMDYESVMQQVPTKFFMEVDAPLFWAPSAEQTILPEDQETFKYLQFMENVENNSGFREFFKNSEETEELSKVSSYATLIKRAIYSKRFMMQRVGKPGLPEYENPLDTLKYYFDPLYNRYSIAMGMSQLARDPDLGLAPGAFIPDEESWFATLKEVLAVPSDADYVRTRAEQRAFEEY